MDIPNNTVCCVLSFFEKLSMADKLSTAGVMISALLFIATVVSVICAFRAYRHQKERAKKEAACNLAHAYADEILSEYRIINTVFDKTGLSEFIKKTFPMDELQQFNFSELSTLCERAEIMMDALDKKMNSFDSLTILDAYVHYSKSVSEIQSLNCTFSDTNQKEGLQSPKNESMLLTRFNSSRVCLLNYIEWFSMSCRYGLADESVLYQSIHQTFLSMVWMLYYYISVNNTSNGDKYFTNTIWLFHHWKNRLAKQNGKAVKKRERAQRTIDNAKKKMDSASSDYHGKVLK